MKTVLSLIWIGVAVPLSFEFGVEWIWIQLHGVRWNWCWKSDPWRPLCRSNTPSAESRSQWVDRNSSRSVTTGSTNCTFTTIQPNHTTSTRKFSGSPSQQRSEAGNLIPSPWWPATRAVDVEAHLCIAWRYNSSECYSADLQGIPGL